MLLEFFDELWRLGVERITGGVDAHMYAEPAFGGKVASGIDQMSSEEVIGHCRESRVDVGGTSAVKAHCRGVDNQIALGDFGNVGGAAADANEVGCADVGQLFNRDGRGWTPDAG